MSGKASSYLEARSFHRLITNIITIFIFSVSVLDATFILELDVIGADKWLL